MTRPSFVPRDNRIDQFFSFVLVAFEKFKRSGVNVFGCPPCASLSRPFRRDFGQNTPRDVGRKFVEVVDDGSFDFRHSFACLVGVGPCVTLLSGRRTYVPRDGQTTHIIFRPVRGTNWNFVIVDFALFNVGFTRVLTIVLILRRVTESTA